MKKIDETQSRFIVSVKVGPKSQIVVPIEARKMFDIKPGDTLMFLGDYKKGIALVKDTEFYKLMGNFYNGSDKDN